MSIGSVSGSPTKPKLQAKCLYHMSITLTIPDHLRNHRCGLQYKCVIEKIDKGQSDKPRSLSIFKHYNDSPAEHHLMIHHVFRLE